MPFARITLLNVIDESIPSQGAASLHSFMNKPFSGIKNSLPLQARSFSDSLGSTIWANALLLSPDEIRKPTGCPGGSGHFQSRRAGIAKCLDISFELPDCGVSARVWLLPDNWPVVPNSGCNYTIERPFFPHKFINLIPDDIIRLIFQDFILQMGEFV